MLLSPQELQLVSRQAILGLDFYLTIKSRFAVSIHRAINLAKERGGESLFDISPQTYIFPGDFEKWRVVASDPNKIWISKPGDGARGEGIYLVTDPSAVTNQHNVLLQEYITNPHLMNARKYTLRFYVAITSLDPLRAWVFPEGLTKLATQPFSLNPNSLDNLFIHLTNPDVLVKDTSNDFTRLRMTHTEYRKQLKEDGYDDNRLFEDIHAVIAKSLLAVREPVLQLQQQNSHHHNSIDEQYMLLGYDILVDSNMRPWVIEVNAGPSLKNDAGETDIGIREQAIKQRVATDILVLAGKLPKTDVKFVPLFPSSKMSDWLPYYELVRESDKSDLRLFHFDR